MDPHGFLGQFPAGAVLDEVQRVPELLSYIQTIVDQKAVEGLFVLTGSQNFLLMDTVAQSLAGRVAIHKLLPLSLEELEASGRPPSGLDELLFRGGYPRLYGKPLDSTQWLGDYVETYLERDVRQLKNVGDLSSFHRFLRMAAYRCGQLLNLSSLASDCGISHNTAKAWLSVLEASFLVFLLMPHHKNFNKRLKKSPKLYFHDTGLLCFLLGVAKPQELAAHSMRGAVFESFVLGELQKFRLNHGARCELYFWQDKLGREVDCLIEKGETLIPLEVKAGRTIGADYFRNLEYWRSLSGSPAGFSRLVYAGEEGQNRREARVLGWRDLGRLGALLS
jgi:predicted AAA+ superfamily ATPase